MENSSHEKREVVTGGSLRHDSLQASVGEVFGVDTTTTDPDLGASSCVGSSTGLLEPLCLGFLMRPQAPCIEYV